MGCRPSRRAAACVRVAGDGPWGVRRSSRSVGASGGVQLRERSAGHGGKAGANPQERYSAPPADTHFPAHSCTTATYHHGCCGRSRITLRLSKNGSTLEIETTEFQDGDRTCPVCGAEEAGEMTSSVDDIVPLRSQSAPNLTTFTRDDGWYCPFPSSPVPRRRHIPGLERVGSGTGSVRTATAVRVDVEKTNCERIPSFPSPADSAASSKVNVPVDVCNGELGDGVGEDLNNGCSVMEDYGAVGASCVEPETHGATAKSVIQTNVETDDLTSFHKENVDVIVLDGVRAAGSKSRIDSPRMVFKAVCHRSSDSLKKVWCHTVADISRVTATAVSAKWDRQSDESTDTGCESDEEDKLQLLSRLEMGPTYVHTDFKNDFEDLFDDTSPDLGKS